MAISGHFDPSGIRLDASQGLNRQLYLALHQRILDGRLAPGTRLPASRDLARLLGVSRNTVLRAYEQLQAEGFFESRVGDGTYVSDSTAELRLSTKVSTGTSTGISTTLSTAEAAKTGHSSSELGFSSAFQRVARHKLSTPPVGPPRAFRVGIPAMDLFPFDVWAKLQSAFWRKPGLAHLGYGDPAGYLRLRELIAAHLRTTRGLDCAAEQIIMTQGSQQALNLCAELLVEPGDQVAVENPGYRAAGHAFAVAGARLRGVPVDNDGMDIVALNALDCRLAYLTPSHQYPTGVTLSLARRLALLEWARQRDGWIIEDDYDGEYRYNGAPLAPVAALDAEQRVFYVGTFGKTVFPALRLGYLVVPRRFAEVFAQRLALQVRHTDLGTQHVMARFIAEGHLTRHIRRMRRAALRRRDALIAHWPVGISEIAPMPSIDAGLHVSVAVDSFAREQALVEKARSVDVEISPLSNYWLPDSNTPVDNRAGLVLGFAAVPEEQIIQACQRLARAWR